MKTNPTPQQTASIDLYAASIALSAAIDKAIERDSWDRNGDLYVSDLRYALAPEDGGGCSWELLGKLQGRPERADTRGVSLMLEFGNMIHERIASWLTMHLGNGWTVTAIEDRCRKNIEPLKGRCDIELTHEKTGTVVVVDVKTKRGAAFNYLNEPKPADVLQVQAYIKSRDADGGVLLYVDREGQNFMKYFLVERDDKAVEGGIDYLKAVASSQQARMPAFLTPRLIRNKNKGKDSLKIEWPWQARWCSLKRCSCKHAWAQQHGTTKLPSGIIGYVKNDGTVEMKEQYKDWREWVEENV